MALKIKASSLLANHYLIVRPDRVIFRETAFFGGTRSFTFNQIEAVLLSPDHKLSFQVGKEVFSIPTKPNKAKHQTAIAALVQEVKRANAAWEMAPPSAAATNPAEG